MLAVPSRKLQAVVGQNVGCFKLLQGERSFDSSFTLGKGFFRVLEADCVDSESWLAVVIIFLIFCLVVIIFSFFIALFGCAFFPWIQNFAFQAWLASIEQQCHITTLQGWRSFLCGPGLVQAPHQPLVQSFSQRWRAEVRSLSKTRQSVLHRSGRAPCL